MHAWTRVYKGSIGQCVVEGKDQKFVIFGQDLRNFLGKKQKAVTIEIQEEGKPNVNERYSILSFERYQELEIKIRKLFTQYS